MLFGGGTAFSTDGWYGPGLSTFLGEIGLGLSFEVSNNCDYFIQGKITAINDGGFYTEVYHPIQTGFNFTL